MKILAIDPGPIKSGWCLYDAAAQSIVNHGIEDNEYVMVIIYHTYCDLLALEMIASYGIPVGATVFETCVWVGRMMQYSLENRPTKIMRVYRKDVAMYLCGTPRAKDGNIRQAIIDLFPATGGGKIPQIGVKKQKGPLYGVKSDVWAAIGVALTAAGAKP